jgi:hypothetical protein
MIEKDAQMFHARGPNIQGTIDDGFAPFDTRRNRFNGVKLANQISNVLQRFGDFFFPCNFFVGNLNVKPERVYQVP